MSKKGELTREERYRLGHLSHKSNFSKTDEEWEEYKDLKRRNGSKVPPESLRYSKQRALYDKY